MSPRDELYGQCPRCGNATPRCECWLYKNFLNMTDEEKKILAEIVRDAQTRVDEMSLSTNALMRDELKQLRAERADLLRLSDPLADWINRAGPALKDLLDAYERRVRSACTTEAELATEPWKCAEWLAADSVLKDKPVAVVELTYPSTNHLD